jgi:hypothetical protein
VGKWFSTHGQMVLQMSRRFYAWADGSTNEQKILRMGRWFYCTNEQKILRIGRYSTNEQMILCIGRWLKEMGRRFCVGMSWRFSIQIGRWFQAWTEFLDKNSWSYECADSSAYA